MSVSDIYRLNGFVTVEDLLSHSACDHLVDYFSNDRAYRSKGGVRNLMSEPAVRTIAENIGLTTLTRELTGDELIPYKATLFEKTGKANWLVAFHQDTALPVEGAPEIDGWGPVSTKDGVLFSHAPTRALRKIVALRVHLDASTTENGPLRVIPGSHQERVLDDREFEQAIQKGPIVECPVGKGGVVAMSPLIFHASSKIKNEMPRRVLHIEYARSLELGDGIRLALA